MRARDNPLTVQRVRAVRYKLRGASWAELRQRLVDLGYRGAIVGQHGHGKTTLMEDLAADLGRDGWEIRSLRLRAGDCWWSRAQHQVLWSGVGPRCLLFVDGVDELAPAARWLLRWLSRRAGGLVVASHRDGLLPTLWRCETSCELLGELLGELGVSGGSRPGPTTEELFRRHDGNLRAALYELYDAYAVLPDPEEESVGAVPARHR